MLLAGCHKEPVSPVDPKPFPSDGNKDLSVAPGDDFFRYCNGTWLKNATIPEGKKVYGGIYIAANKAKADVAALYDEDPVLRKVIAGLGTVQAQPQASKAYIDKLLAMVPDPEQATVEEYTELIGRLTRMGVEEMLVVFITPQDGKFEVSVLPMIFADLIEDIEEPVPSPDNPGEDSRHFLDLIAKGLGIDPSFIQFSKEDRERDVYATCLKVDKAALAQAIRDSIKDLERFTDSSNSVNDLRKDVEHAATIYADYLYAKKYVSPSLKQSYMEVCENLRTHFSRRIASLDWMSDATKAFAQEKLAAITFHVAYPDNWFPETYPTIEGINACSSFVEEYLYLYSCYLDYILTLGGKSCKEYEHQEYLISHQTGEVGAAYDTRINSVFIKAATLLPPMMSPDITEARTYATFAIVGHEMTHGFDVDGATRDKDGKEKNWWTVADKMAFEDRMKLLVECFNHLEIAPDIMPGTYCNGTVTLEENIADLGGVNIALDAYTERLIQQGYSGSALKDQQRKFFESYADIWCCLYGQEFIESRTDGKRPDKHALPRERVNGIVMNIDLWYDLYNVTRENLLYLPPERRTYIW